MRPMCPARTLRRVLVNYQKSYLCSNPLIKHARRVASFSDTGVSLVYNCEMSQTYKIVKNQQNEKNNSKINFMKRKLE